LTVDVTFRKIPKTATCFAIWKIDDNRLDAELKVNFGKFRDDCAYILYAACKSDSFVTSDTLVSKPTHL